MNKSVDKMKTVFSFFRNLKSKTKWNLKKKFMLSAGIIFFSGLIFFVISNLVIAAQGEKVYFSTGDLPETHAALVLGCSPTLRDNRNNFYFLMRIEAAAKLYKSGKIKKLLLSGDNGRKGYNEPEAMRQALIAYGVPDEDIYCDYAGFSTLDSIIRAKTVFGQEKFIIVSQPFHCERAIFLAGAKDLDVCGFAAQDLNAWKWKLKNHFRESLARPAAVIDLLTFRTAKFGGRKIDMSIPQIKAEN